MEFLVEIPKERANVKTQAWHEEEEGEGGGQKEEGEKKTGSRKKWIKERTVREEVREVDKGQITILKAIVGLPWWCSG